MKSDNKKMVLPIIGLIILGLLAWMLFSGSKPSIEEQAAIDAQELKASQTSKLSLISKCQNAVQPTLKNPKSMNVEYIDSATAVMSTGQLGAVMKYYAKNSFGGEVLNTTNCLFDTDGNLLEFADAK